MSDDPTNVIDCEVVPLPTPLRLATPGFIAQLVDVEQRIAALKITDAATAQEAATLQQRLTTAGKILEETRVKLNAPVLEQQRKINAIAKIPAERIERAKTALKTALTAFDNEQRRLAQEAERARQAELARLEKLRLAEEAEVARKAAELAKQAAEARAKAEAAAKATGAPPIQEMDFGSAEPAEPPPKTETEKAIEAVKFAPAVVTPKPSGIAWKVTLVPTVTDVKALPDLFQIRTANMAAIRATFCAGYREGEPIPTCPGCAFEVKREPVSTGR